MAVADDITRKKRDEVQEMTLNMLRGFAFSTWLVLHLAKRSTPT